MKIKKGKIVWLSVAGILLLIMLIGTIGTLIKYGDFQLINVIVIFLLVANISNYIEKK